MTSGVYKRTPEMKTGKYKRTPEMKKGGKYERTPEIREKTSKGLKNSDAVKAKADAQRGVPLSPDRIAAMSEGLKNSDANKAQIESMRGGNDLVIHHYIYDESDLSLNTMQMTRSDHTSLHNVLRNLGYIVPHINVTEENKNVFGEYKDEQ